MISLISKWKLRNGCPAELASSIKQTVSQVEKAEPGTLLYSVHVDATSPSNGKHSAETDVPDQQIKQTEITFFEIYKNKQSFEAHINGPAFTKFVKQNLHYFHQDPKKPGWPLTQTQFLDRIAAFIRPQAGE